jgi:type II secretory pathway component PulJ
MKRSYRASKGFTLIELLVVIATNAAGGGELGPCSLVVA